MIILPLSKPDKLEELISSYRPINNLVCIEKIIEQYLQQCIVKFLTTNKSFVTTYTADGRHTLLPRQ